MTFWRRSVQRPQDLFLRKVLFQIHLWTGIAVGMYVLVIRLRQLVYQNELYRTFLPKPMIVAGSSNPMAVAALKSAASRVYPDYDVTEIGAKVAIRRSIRHRA